MKHKSLVEYADAARQIELGYACIGILESMNGAIPSRCIKQLRVHAQQALRKMDHAAEKLTASNDERA